LKQYAKAKPIYKEFKGWKEDITKCTKFEDLPEAAQVYVRFIEEYTGTPACLVSVNPEREGNCILRPLL
jgi:adenylosuccinate synthase